VGDVGTYWIDAKIRIDGKSVDAYDTIQVDTVANRNDLLMLFDIPQRPLVIVSIIVGAVAVFGLIQKKRIIREI